MWFVQPDSYSLAILAACTDSATMNTSPDMSNKSSMLTSSFSRLENSSSTSLSLSHCLRGLTTRVSHHALPTRLRQILNLSSMRNFPPGPPPQPPLRTNLTLPRRYHQASACQQLPQTNLPRHQHCLPHSRSQQLLGTNLPHHPQFHQLPMLPRHLMSCRQRLLKSPLSWDRVLLMIHCPWTFSVCRTSN